MVLRKTLLSAMVLVGLVVAIPTIKPAIATFNLQASQTTAQATDVTIQQKNMQTIKTYFELLSQKRMNEWLQLWAEDGVQDMPFSPPGFPKRVEGKAAVAKHYSALPKSVGRMVFPDLKIYPTTDPNVLFVEFRGEIEVLATGKPYNNTYAGLFQFRDGKVVLFREYYNPIVFIEAWGRPSGFTSQE